jgi:hypothetical protein
MTLHGLYELSASVLLLAILPVLMTGWAALARRCLGLPNDVAFSADNLWLGFICLVAGLGILHLVMPIAWLSRGVMVGMSLVGLAIIPNLGQQLATLWQSVRRNPGVFLCLLIAALLLCLKALQVTRNFDSALYHFQTIRWLNEYAIVPGLGNLHGRLAFNQSYFNFLAFLHIQPLALKGYVTGSVFLALLCSASIFNLYKSLRVGQVWVTVALATGLAITFDSLSSPTPDTAIALVQLQMFVYLIRYFVQDQPEREADLQSIVMIISLAFVIVTIKISALLFAAGCVVVLLPFVLRASKDDKLVLIKLICVCIALMCVHFLRGYILSGTPLYPSTIGALWSLPWTMLPVNIKGEAVWIYSWARLPGAMPIDVLGNWDWFRPWLANQSALARVLFSVGMVLIVLNLLLLFRRPTGPQYPRLYSLYIPLAGALFFWFFTAPDFRFLGAIPVLFATLAGLLCWLRLDSLTMLTARFVGLAHKIRQVSRHGFVALVVALICLYFYHPRSMTLRLAEPLPLAEVIQKTTNFGAVIGMPKNGLCWDSALPCARFVEDGLKLLNPARGIGSGFTMQ